VNNFKHNLVAAICLMTSLIVTTQANTITIDELALWAGGSIGVGSGVTVSGPMASALGVNANSNSSLSSIYTQGNVWLGKGVIVNGDVVANGSIQTSKNTVITGSSNSFSNFVLPQLDTLQQTVVGTTPIYTAPNATKTLLPGEYSSLSLSNDTQLNLSSGIYSVSSFWMGSGGTVNVDTSAGDVILNVVGSFTAGSSVKFITSGSGNLFVNVFNSDAWLDSRVDFTGVLSVFGGGLGTGTSVNLTGSVYTTGSMYLGNDTAVTYTHSTQIPEPASLAMFLTIGFIIWKVRQGSTDTSVSVWSARIMHCY